MTLRIVRSEAGGEAVIALHGWLRDAEVGVFETTSSAIPLPLHIDLENLAGADGAGLQALHRERRRGAQLASASPYIALLLERAERRSGDEV